MMLSRLIGSKLTMVWLWSAVTRIAIETCRTTERKWVDAVHSMHRLLSTYMYFVTWAYGAPICRGIGVESLTGFDGWIHNTDPYWPAAW